MQARAWIYLGLHPSRRALCALLRMRERSGDGKERPLRQQHPDTKKKKDQLTLAQCGISALGPVPTIPGGWGLRNPKPKEPDQRSIFFSQVRAAGDWPNWGGIVIPSNDPVTSATVEISSCARLLIAHDFPRRTARSLGGATLRGQVTCAGISASGWHWTIRRVGSALIR
jgi:hypothetical protein